jgi:quercetin dioxygenase-like cupin family protein
MRNEPQPSDVGTLITDGAAPPEPKRRAVLGALLAVGLASIAGAALARRAVATSRRRTFEEVAHRAHEASQALAEGRIDTAGWQQALESIFQEVSPQEIGESIDLDALLARTPDVPRGASVLTLAPELPGGPLPGFATKLFVLRKGRSNPPHAHDNMVSMHYVLRGQFRVRHYDRIRDERDAIVVKPTIDRVIRPGESTSISEEHDNVHWHLAESDGVLLDVLRAGLDDRPTETHLVDPVASTPLAGGLLRAPRLPTVDKALERFG